jgi:mono/diheme cytochrome c family protein
LTEVPEHLYERSKARRAALGLGGGGDAAPVPAAGDTSDATPATADAASAPVAAAAAAAAVPAVVKELPPPPPFVQAGIDRKRIPWWAASVLGLLPLWAVVYAGTLSEADTGEPSQIELGAEVYALRCASCHGGSGGGGTGPALAGGAVLETFPERADHLRWVYGGSVGWPDSTYGEQNKPKQGGMPEFGEELTPEELLAVVRYEREVLSGQELDEETEVVDAEERLAIVTPEGEVDALAHYFGEEAEASEAFTVVDDEPFINGAKFSAPAE